jgi:hypothetical protein
MLWPSQLPQFQRRLPANRELRLPGLPRNQRGKDGQLSHRELAAPVRDRPRLDRGSLGRRGSRTDRLGVYLLRSEATRHVHGVCRLVRSYRCRHHEPVVAVCTALIATGPRSEHPRHLQLSSARARFERDNHASHAECATTGTPDLLIHQPNRRGCGSSVEAVDQAASWSSRWGGRVGVLG